MCKEDIKAAIDSGRTALGIEFGSTRIKAVLITDRYEVAASGSYTWSSVYENGFWTYDLSRVREGLRQAYAEMAESVKEQYQTELSVVGSMGISAMMHGYLAFDGDRQLLTPFRTWQNTTTEAAAAELSELFDFNIPQRWSISHLYQAILNKEEHVSQIRYLVTLAGYVHWLLTGENVLGIGDASGMFPIDSKALAYDRRMMDLFAEKVSGCGYPWSLEEILPTILTAGQMAGKLTEEGAKLLDPTGTLQAGIPFAPPEGDAGTGMTATNAVTVGTGNVSAGTSAFAMVVLDKMLEKAYPEIDMVTTPSGDPVAMVHCNNCTNDLSTWVKLFGEYSESMKTPVGIGDVYETFYAEAEKGEKDCGGVVVCNFVVGEPVAGVADGCPMVVRMEKKPFTLANFCRASLYSTIASLKMGMDILEKESVHVTRLMCHGGLFNNGDTGSRIMAAAMKTNAAAMKTAVVGGAYGMAVLALYTVNKAADERLEDFLTGKVFDNAEISEVEPDPADVQGFDAYMKHFKVMLKAEKELLG